jgi:hypothetical protein
MGMVPYPLDSRLSKRMFDGTGWRERSGSAGR